MTQLSNRVVKSSESIQLKGGRFINPFWRTWGLFGNVMGIHPRNDLNVEAQDTKSMGESKAKLSVSKLHIAGPAKKYFGGEGSGDPKKFVYQGWSSYRPEIGSNLIRVD